MYILTYVNHEWKNYAGILHTLSKDPEDDFMSFLVVPMTVEEIGQLMGGN
jgi:hypothetical protein